jgi:hypothetical protein
MSSPTNSAISAASASAPEANPTSTTSGCMPSGPRYRLRELVDFPVGSGSDRAQVLEARCSKSATASSCSRRREVRLPGERHQPRCALGKARGSCA